MKKRKCNHPAIKGGHGEILMNLFEIQHRIQLFSIKIGISKNRCRAQGGKEIENACS